MCEWCKEKERIEEEFATGRDFDKDGKDSAVNEVISKGIENMEQSEVVAEGLEAESATKVVNENHEHYEYFIFIFRILFKCVTRMEKS